jgi:hypothetical protein
METVQENITGRLTVNAICRTLTKVKKLNDIRFLIQGMSQFELFWHPNNDAAIKCSTLFTYLIIRPHILATAL